ARSFGERPALTFGDRRLHDYAGLQNAVVRLAGGLRALPGVRPGDRIGLAMKNCPQYIELMWACWHAGLCIVPINAKLHPREIAFILENCGVAYCFCTEDIAQAMAPIASDIPGLRRIVDVDGAELKRLRQAEPLALEGVDPARPAWLFYT